MDASQTVELLTEEQFVDHLSRGGVIVIHDDANRAGSKRVAHLQTERKACSHIDVDDFRLKVLAHRQRNGRYWWARNSKVAERELQASLCAQSERLLGRN
jgi:hypothetical protein